MKLHKASILLKEVTAMTSLDFYALPWYKKILVKIAEFFVAIGKGVANFVIGAPGAVWRFIKMIGRGLGCSEAHLFTVTLSPSSHIL